MSAGNSRPGGKINDTHTQFVCNYPFSPHTIASNVVVLIFLKLKHLSTRPTDKPALFLRNQLNCMLFVDEFVDKR